MSGPCFLCALVHLYSRGDMLVGTNKRHPVSSWGRRELLHARTRTHQDRSAFLHAYMPACYPSAAATCCQRLPHLLPLLALRKPGPHARLCLPLCTAVCNRSGARLPQPLPSQAAAAGLSAAALPPPALSAAAARFAQTKTPRSLGDILEKWGLSKHSATGVTAGCWSLLSTKPPRLHGASQSCGIKIGSNLG